jgi:hypothetical protein
VPGIYEVRTTFVNTQGVKILPEYRCQDDDDCSWIPSPPGVETDQYIGGGLDLLNETGYWFVTASELKKGASVKFKVIELPLPVYVEDMDESGDVEKYTLQYRSLLEPVFS